MIPKFRAWDKRKQLMREVAVLHFNKNGNVSGIEYWKTPYDLQSIHANYINVMQSTGLKDKNGVEIFEGDIVLFTIEDGFDYVYGKPGRINLSLQWGAGVRASSGGNYPLRKCREVKIIGNIYENPELLEVES